LKLLFKMVYRIGIVGAGHWSRRLNMGIKEDQPLEIHKTVDVLTYDQKKELLQDLEISRDRHYRIEAGDPLPDDFFDGLDVVQIASPVEYHRQQTLESLEQGVLTITEKSYGANRDEFDEVMDYIGSNDLWNSSYLHLHYLKKLLTMEMPSVVSHAVEEYGEVERVEATFIEEWSEEDERRSWLFNPDNGGVFLDWIHPIEVLASCSAEFTKLLDGDGYLVAPSYTDEYATAARAEYAVEGDLFAEDARATVRVGKGFDDGTTHKVMRFVFDDAYLDFEYASSEREFETDYRGEWVLKNGDGDVVDRSKPRGPIPYYFLIREVQEALEGGETPLDEDAIRRMYEPVWMFNEQVGMETPVRDENEIESFVAEAVNTTSNGKPVRR
ncbi:MAG: hypothetical protein SXQ77_10650, partial [Halobacteria archaeon]|nr:hypothetical protein [Halobacteria archaeon]